MIRTAFAAALQGLILCASASSAPIYKCTGEDGSIAYADAPCGTDPQVQSADSTSPVPSPIPVVPNSHDQNRQETAALQCTTETFNEWVRNQHPLPEWPIRRTKYVEVANQCRHMQHLSEVAPQVFVSAVPGNSAARSVASTRVPADQTFANLVKGGSIEQLQTYLSTQGVSINDRSDNDKTLLDHAAEQNQFKVAEFLIDHGASIEAKQTSGPNSGLTALHRAASADAADVAELLIAHGAVVNVHGPLGATPLILAASNGSRRTVEILLKHGADISIRTGARQTALSEATAHGHSDIVRMLLMYARVPNARGLDQMAARGDLDSLRAILMHDASQHDIATSRKNSMLRYVIVGGVDRPAERQRIIELLIADGADVNNRVLVDMDNRTTMAPNTPLMLATTPDLLEFLIDHGADVRAEGAFGTAVEAVACNPSVKDPIGAVRTLLAHGATIATVPNNGRTALQCAAASRRPDFVEFLLASGWPVDARDANGQTALFDARDQATIAVLLKHGADIDALDKWNRTALMVAVDSGNLALATTLKNLGADPRAGLSAESAYGNAGEGGAVKNIPGAPAKSVSASGAAAPIPAGSGIKVQRRGNVADIAMEGSLAATNTLGCVALEQVSPFSAPPDLYLGVRECIEHDRYAEAVALFALAGMESQFDAARISDKTAGQAGQVLIMGTFGSLTAAKRDKFRSVLTARVADARELGRLCRSVSDRGPPKYYPTYMILHGMSAINGALNGQVAGPALDPSFDGVKTWKALQTSYLNCPPASRQQ